MLESGLSVSTDAFVKPLDEWRHSGGLTFQRRALIFDTRGH